jgi:hypothetical protein
MHTHGRLAFRHLAILDLEELSMVQEGTRSRRPFPRLVPDEVLEHAWNAREEFRKSVAALLPSLPPEFTEHRRAARREMLLAIRSLIDSAIERVEKEKSTPAE